MTTATSPARQQLAAQPRPARGTRQVRRLRQSGLIPAVLYGKGVEPVPIAINGRELARLLHARRGEHSLVTVRVDAGAAWEKPALIHAVQHDPVSGHIIHVDFHAIQLTARLKIKVPLVLTGEPVGVKQEGGVLEHFLREIEVECLPTQIPERVEFDASALKTGDAVHVKDLTAPAGARITSDPGGVVASVQAPKAEKPEEGAAAPSEPEVLREKKEEDGAPGEAGEAKAEPAKAEKVDKKEKS